MDPWLLVDTETDTDVCKRVVGCLGDMHTHTYFLALPAEERG